MKKEFTLIEIKDEKPIKEWAHLLMTTRHQEAVDSLAFEGVDQENCFYLELDGKKYLAYYSEGEIIGPSDKTIQVNKDHIAVLKSIRIRRIDGEILYNLSRKVA